MRKADARRGTVVSVHGEHARVHCDDERVRRLRRRRQAGALACGDEIEWRAAGRGGEILSRAPRRSELMRYDANGRPRPVAANLDQVVVVWAPFPPSPPTFLDRYLVNLEIQGLRGIIAANKNDHPDTDGQRARLRELYTGIGYRWLDLSAHNGDGVAALREALMQSCAAFVGQSGVGKSSLVNRLIGERTQAVGALSGDQSHGRHTTSASRLLLLDGGIRVIDSPGVRDFATGHIPPRELAGGFPEIAERAVDCRFRDCWHREEPDCAVRAATASGSIAESRMQSYLSMLEDSEALATW